jgi:hypothetical protein
MVCAITSLMRNMISYSKSSLRSGWRSRKAAHWGSGSFATCAFVTARME